MNTDERRKVLHIICDLEDCHKRKETYKAYLQATAAGRRVPREDCMEICERLIAERSAANKRVAELFLAHYDFVTEGLDTGAAQQLLDTVSEERRRWRSQ